MKTRAVYLCTMLIASLLTGCIDDDYSKCPPKSNVALMFRYSDQNGADRFQDRIGSVVLSVFDDSEQVAYTRAIGKSSLGQFQGDNFYLAPGTYRVVCWGNIDGHSKLSSLGSGTRLGESYLTLETGSPKTSSDPVMYAPRPASLSRALEAGDIFRLTVPAQGEAQETIDFVSAHTAFKVVVIGLANIEGRSDIVPDIEISGLPEEYDFSMKTRGGTEAYRKSSENVDTANGTEARAYFNSGNFKQDDPVTVSLFSGIDGRLLKEVYLPDYLTANNIDLSAMLERSATITIEFTTTGVNVTVSFSPWMGEDVEVEW